MGGFRRSSHPNGLLVHPSDSPCPSSSSRRPLAHSDRSPGALGSSHCPHPAPQHRAGNPLLRLPIFLGYLKPRTASCAWMCFPNYSYSGKDVFQRLISWGSVRKVLVRVCLLSTTKAHAYLGNQQDHHVIRCRHSRYPVITFPRSSPSSPGEVSITPCGRWTHRFVEVKWQVKNSALGQSLGFKVVLGVTFPLLLTLPSRGKLLEGGDFVVLGAHLRASFCS